MRILEVVRRVDEQSGISLSASVSRFVLLGGVSGTALGLRIVACQV